MINRLSFYYADVNVFTLLSLVLKYKMAFFTQKKLMQEFLDDIWTRLNFEIFMIFSQKFYLGPFDRVRRPMLLPPKC